MWGSCILGIVALLLILRASSITSTTAHSSLKPVALSPAPNAAWLEAVRQNIERDQYRPKPQNGDGSSWGLSNRANGLSSHVSHRGWEIRPEQAPQQRDAKPDWNWRYQFTGVRRGAKGGAGSVNSIDANDERVTISRVGQIREWYSNSRLGIEQGFDLLVKPEGSPSDAVILEGAVETSLRAEKAERDSLTFSYNGTPVLSYAGLKTIDATGSAVPSWFSLETTANGGVVRIHIDDSGAHYPIHVDPLASSPQWSVIGEQEMSSLTSVAEVGDINNDGYDDVAVGDPNFQGANSALGKAYVYYGSAVGLSTTPGWSLASSLRSQFGAEVAGAGDVNQDGFDDVVIGAPAESVEGIGYPGKAYLFLGSATGLSESPAWSTHGATSNGYYGLRLSGGGDVNGDGFSDVLVGEPWAESPVDGYSYLYLGSASGLSATPAWTRSAGTNQVAGSPFTLTFAGDVNADGFSDVALGSSLYENGQTAEGALFLFHGSASGLSSSPTLIIEGGDDNVGLAKQVSSARDVNHDGFSDVIVSCITCGNKAFLFLGGASGLNSSPAWTGNASSDFMDYGHALAGLGDINGDSYDDVAVSAPNHGNGGVVAIYLGTPGGLTNYIAWLGEGNAFQASYGQDVAGAGDVNGDGYRDVLIVGSGFLTQIEGSYYSGKVVLLEGGPSGLKQDALWRAEGNVPGAYFGSDLASAGDVNNDGFPDIIIGAPFFANGETDEGAAFLFLGSSSGPSTNPAWSYESNGFDGLLGFRLGTSVDSAGDVNGDGFDDVVVGVPGYKVDQDYPGAVFLFLGSSSGLSGTPDWIQPGPPGGAGSYGFSLAGIGDVNNDSFGDIAVKAYTMYNGGWHHDVHIFYGSSAGLPPAPSASLLGALFPSSLNTEHFGRSLDGAGDVNGDGFDDVVIGSDVSEANYIDQGRAYLFYGSATGVQTSPAWSLDGPQANDHFGHRVASAGDVNGDGFTDIAVGSLVDFGKTFVFHGSGSGLPTAANWTFTSGGFADSYYGIASAGDVNNDGLSDLVIGAGATTVGTWPFAGKVYLFLGTLSGLSPDPSWIQTGTGEYQSFGVRVAGAGDINNDGFDDLLVGSSAFSNGQSSEGAAFLWLGYGTNPATPTPTITPGGPPTNTPTPTPTRTPTRTPTPTPTRTPTPTPTDTPLGEIPTDTPTETPTDTPLDGEIPTDTPTETPTDTPLDGEIPTDTPTETPTDTPLDGEIPTDTPTETPTDTPLDGEIPTDTPTETPTPTPTETPSFSPPWIGGSDTLTIFVSSTTFTGGQLWGPYGEAPGLEGARAVCQQLANSAGLTGEWFPLISSSTWDARSVTGATGGGPIYNSRHEIVALNRSDLWDGPPYSLANAVRYDEYGSDLSEDLISTKVFTGTTGAGYRVSVDPADFCGDWTTTEGVTHVGDVSSANEYWIDDDPNHSCNIDATTRILCVGNYEPAIPTPTDTPTATDTPDPSVPQPTHTATATPTNTRTPTPTRTPTRTPTATRTQTSTVTPTRTPSATPSPTPTGSSHVPPISTPQPQPSPTATPRAPSPGDPQPPSPTPTPEACSALPQCKPDPKLSAADKPKPPTVSVTGSSKVTISLSPAILGYPTDPSRQSALNTKLKKLAGKKPINLTKLLRPFYVIKVTPGGLRPSEAAPMAIVKSVNYEGKAPKVTVQLAPGSYRVTGAVSVKTAAGKPFAVGQVSAPIVITVK